MVSSRNKKLLMEKSGQKVQKFGIKRLKVGVVSVAITAGLLVSHNTLQQVHAEEVADEHVVELVEEPVELAETDEVVEETFPDETSEEIIEAEPPAEESDVLDEETPSQELQTASTFNTMTALPQIEEGNFRLHFDELPEGDPSSMGLWMWVNSHVATATHVSINIFC